MTQVLKIVEKEWKDQVKEPLAWDRYAARDRSGKGLNWCALSLHWAHRRYGIDIASIHGKWHWSALGAVWRTMRVLDELGLRSDGPEVGGMYIMGRGRATRTTRDPRTGVLILATGSPAHIGITQDTPSNETQWTGLEGNMGHGDGNDGWELRTYTRPEARIIAYYRAIIGFNGETIVTPSGPAQPASLFQVS